MAVNGTPTYALLQQLVGRFAEYDRRTEHPSLAEFGTWLAARETAEPEPEVVDQERAQARYYDDLSPDMQPGALLGRLSHFAHRYAADILADLPVGSIREFGVLAAVGYHGQPNKTEVAYTNLLELSTVTEVTRRLTLAGLLQELADATDRRTRRLQLTAEGQQALKAATERMRQLNARMFGPLPAPEQGQLLHLLRVLNEAHTAQLFAAVSGGKVPAGSRQ
jgi:DNA-binding MarR family transcriptional regulator